MLKLKYLFEKACFIAAVLGYLRYLTFAFVGWDVGWNMFSESWSIVSNSGILGDMTIFAKQLLKMSANFLWLDSDYVFY